MISTQEQIPFMTKVTLSEKDIVDTHSERMDSVKKFLNAITELKYLPQNNKEKKYYGNHHNKYISTNKKIGIKREIALCKSHLSDMQEQEAKQYVMQHGEDELRLILVKNFIYG